MSQTLSVRKVIYLLVLSVFFNSLSKAQSIGSYTDSRDGQSYKTVTYIIDTSRDKIIDDDEYGTYVSGKSQKFKVLFNGGIPSSMTWMTQNMNFKILDSKCKYDSDINCETYGRLYTWEAASKVCSEGWHLPSDEEWYILASLYEGVSSAGQHLKSERLSGTNKSLFNVKKPSIFWSSTELDSVSAMDWKVNFRWVKLQRWKGGKNLYNSVRCVKDY